MPKATLRERATERAERIIENTVERVGGEDFDTLATVGHKIRQRARDVRDIHEKDERAMFWFEVADVIESRALSLLKA